MQVPAQVEYERATSVAHALTLLTRYGPEARILAGGHSLIPMMKLRLAQPETLIDINGLAELSYIRVADGELQIGALTRHAELLDSALAGEHFAILHDAERVIADPVVRNWGTIGGSLCQADPSEDLSATFAALKATMVICHPDGSRTVSARDFHTGPYETVVAPGELLTEISIPIRPGVELPGRHGPGAVRAADRHDRLERGERRGQVLGRVRLAQRPADRAPVAHHGVGDDLLRVVQDREVLAGGCRCEQLRVPGERADLQFAAGDAQVGKLAQPVDVDEGLRLRKPQLHHRDQAVPAGQHPGLGPEPGQQGQRMFDAGRLLVLDLRRDLHPALLAVCLA